VANAKAAKIQAVSFIFAKYFLSFYVNSSISKSDERKIIIMRLGVTIDLRGKSVFFVGEEDLCRIASQRYDADLRK
jgi:hypothetical protein